MLPLLWLSLIEDGMLFELLFKLDPFSFVISNDKVNGTFVYQVQCFFEGTAKYYQILIKENKWGKGDLGGKRKAKPEDLKKSSG
jgi:hypothetical protein